MFFVLVKVKQAAAWVIMMKYKKSRILIVDNHPGDIQPIVDILGVDYDITLISDGTVVLDKVAEIPRPNLILINAQLMMVNSYGICRKLKENPKTELIPVIFFSIKFEPADEVQGFEAGAVDFISQPWNLSIILARVKTHLATGRLLSDTKELSFLTSEQLAHETYLHYNTREHHSHVYQGKTAVIRLLETALQPLSLQAQLRTILDIITEMPFLNNDGRAAVFLAKPDNSLSIVTHKGIDEKFIQQCMNSSCTQAAREQKIIFIDCHDNDHQPHLGYPETADHGYCIVPLLEKERLLGILIFYLISGYQPCPEEYQLIEEMGRVVSELIARRLMEAVIQVKKFELQDTQEDIIRKLGLASEYRDTDTGFHVLRVGQYTARIAAAFGVSQEEQALLMLSAQMHDVGKIGIPDSILLKQGKLTRDEFSIMKSHTIIGSRILVGNSRIMETARTIALTHHEKWDGTGYPHGLIGKNIPLFGRMCAIADVFDALTMERPYKPAWSTETALNLIKEQAGKHFDPCLTDAFTECFVDILSIKRAYSSDDCSSDDENIQTLLHPMNIKIGKNPLWKDEYLLGIDLIDGHHRYLFKLVHNLENALLESQNVIKICTTLKEMENYALIHFSTEERLMRGYNDPNYSTHKAAHQLFIKKIQELWEMIRVNPLLVQFDMLSFLKDWLIKHIIAVDSKLHYLSKKKPSITKLLPCNYLLEQIT
ncbi:putative two-component system response regulator [Gammaproteobacteria bacterium]